MPCIPMIGLRPLLLVLAAAATLATGAAEAKSSSAGGVSGSTLSDLAIRLGAQPLPTRQVWRVGYVDMVDPTLRVLLLPSRGEVSQVTIGGLPELPDLTVMPVRTTPIVAAGDSLTLDTHPASPFDNLRDGVVFSSGTIPANPASTAQRQVVYANGGSQRAFDIDLYVGIDLNGDGLPQADEVLCSGTGPERGEECFFTLPPSASSRTLWTLAQMYSNAYVLQYDSMYTFMLLPALDGPADDRVIVTGPGKAAANTPVTFNISTHLPGFRYFESVGGLIAVKAHREDATPTVLIPLQPLLFSDGRTDQLLGNRAVGGHIVDQVDTLMAPGEAGDRIAIDVPVNATSMQVTTSGSGEVDLYVAKGDAESIRGPALGTAPPRTAAQGSSIHPGASERVDLAGASLTPGRWYLTPVNVGDGNAKVTVAVDLAVSTTAAPQVRATGYYNPARSGHGMFLSDGASDRVLIWYTYDSEGQPTWYYAQSPRPGSADAVWSADLYRYTWNGSRSNGVNVGRVLTTATAANRFQFTALVDGRYVSEPMIELAGQECPVVNSVATDYSGSWYPPASPGTGTSVLTLGRTEVQIAYLYDRNGNPRWLYGQVSPFGVSTLPLSQFSGFCPSCTYRSAHSGHDVVDAVLVPPLAGNWLSNQDTEKLTVDVPCR